MGTAARGASMGTAGCRIAPGAAALGGERGRWDFGVAAGFGMAAGSLGPTERGRFARDWSSAWAGSVGPTERGRLARDWSSAWAGSLGPTMRGRFAGAALALTPQPQLQLSVELVSAAAAASERACNRCNRCSLLREALPLAALEPRLQSARKEGSSHGDILGEWKIILPAPEARERWSPRFSPPTLPRGAGPLALGSAWGLGQELWPNV